MPPLKIAVIGSGAVGCYYGSKLARGGHDVHFLMRADLDRVRSHGLEIRSHAEPTVLLRDEISVHGDTEAIGPCDLVIIALKATANAALLTLIPPLLEPKTRLLTLQNGLGNEAYLATHFGEERVLGGLCFVCINRLAPGVVEHFSQGTVAMGRHGADPDTWTRALAETWIRCGIECQLMDDLRQARWRKLVWNVPFNGIAIAAGGVDVSVILASSELSALAKALMTEIIGIATELGLVMPADLIADQFAKTAEMGPYKPSSLLDFLNQRPVEVEAIWGEAYRQGRALGSPVGHLETLYWLLKALCVEA